MESNRDVGKSLGAQRLMNVEIENCYRTLCYNRKLYILVLILSKACIPFPDREGEARA